VSDIQQATAIARAMVTQYGMSEKLGPISFDSSGSSVFIGRDFAQTKAYSEKVAAEIDDEIKSIFDEAMALCEQILTEHADLLVKTAEYLLEHEVMDGNVFAYLCEHGELPTGNIAEASMFTHHEAPEEKQAEKLPEDIGRFIDEVRRETSTFEDLLYGKEKESEKPPELPDEDEKGL